MKKIIGAAVVAVGLLAGCSDTGRVQQVGGSSEGGGSAPTSTVGTSNDGTGTAVDGTGGSGAVLGSTQSALINVELRMRAKNADNFNSLMLVANTIQVLADGRPVKVIPTWNVMNLANMQHAEKIGTALIPANATRVDIKVGMGAGGGFDTQTETGWIDARTKTISYVTTVNQLEKEMRSVIEVDAAKSFPAKDGQTRVFVPNFRIY